MILNMWGYALLELVCDGLGAGCDDTVWEPFFAAAQREIVYESQRTSFTSNIPVHRTIVS